MSLLAAMSGILGVSLTSRNAIDIGGAEIALVACLVFGFCLVALNLSGCLVTQKKLFIPQPWLVLFSFLLIVDLLILEMVYPTKNYSHVGMGCVSFSLLFLMSFFCARLDARRILIVLLGFVLGGCTTTVFFFLQRVYVPEIGESLPGVMDVFSIVILWMLITSSSARNRIGQVGLIFCLIAFSLILVKVLHADRRGPVAVILITVLAYEFFHNGRITAFLKRIMDGYARPRMLVVGLGLVVLGLFMALFLASSNRLSEHRLERAVTPRVLVAAATLEVGLERPLFGHGAGTDQPGIKEIGYKTKKVHNLYIEIFFRQGLFGLILWGLVWGNLFRPKPILLSKKDEREFWQSIDALGKAIAIGVAVFGMISAKMDRPEIFVLFGMFLGFYSSKHRLMERG